MKNITERERHRLNNNWEYAKKLWKKRSVELGLTDWKLKMDHAKTRLGQCDHGKKTISISSYFMRGKSCNYNKVKATILHEMAHSLTLGHNHDKVWKKKCVEIGGDGRVKATMDIPPRSWRVKCRKCPLAIEYYRRPNIKNKICPKCKSSVKLTKIN